MTLDNTAPTAPTDEELPAIEFLGARPENLWFGLSTVGGFVAYHRLNPPSEEFWGCEPGSFPLSVGICGLYGHPLDVDDDRPDQGTDAVVLGVHGSAGRRLTNVLLEPSEALRLAKLLKKAAKKSQSCASD